VTYPKLKLVDLRKEYDDGSVIAVDGIDLAVEAGETMALLGASGCGKSTTLNMIIGLEYPTSGDIQMDGKSITGIPAGKRDIGLVFQDYAVFTSMTVRQNLAFGLKLRKVARSVIDGEVKKMAALLGMEDKLDTRATALGGSELQRVAIGRTLVTKPSLLLLDEPLSNLEPEARLSMRQELRRLQQEIGLTIIYVTHDQVEALSLADHVAVMRHGKIVQVGRTSSIVKNPGHVHVAEFLGSPPMNILRGNVTAEERGVRFTGYNFNFLFPPCTVPECVATHSGEIFSLGFRADTVSLVQAGEGLITGTVIDIESRGADALVSVDAGGKILKSVIPVPHFLQTSEIVGIMLDPAAIHIFGGFSNLKIDECFHNISPENPAP
jgi:multiple sugar transport system ATP-binding protein